MAAGAAVAGHPLRWRSGLALPEALMASWRAARGLPAPFKRRGARRVPRRGGEHAGRRYPLWTLGSRPPIVLVLLREATSIAGRGKEQLSGPRGKRRTSSRGASGFRWGAAARGRWQSCEQQGGGSLIVESKRNLRDAISQVRVQPGHQTYVNGRDVLCSGPAHQDLRGDAGRTDRSQSYQQNPPSHTAVERSDPASSYASTSCPQSQGCGHSFCLVAIP